METTDRNWKEGKDYTGTCHTCQNQFIGPKFRVMGRICRLCSEERAKAELQTPTGTEAEVCRDIAERQRKGLAKYGVSVRGNPLNFRAWLQHSYEEALDQAIYLKRAIEELDKSNL